MNNRINIKLGIDLGTTNTVASWSSENQKGEIVTEILKIDMLDITGMIKTDLLPSYIFFDEKNRPIIGKKAKSMICKQPERVIKNSKSFMGTNKEFVIGEKNILPEEAASMILIYIKKYVERYFGFFPEDVVITVPASFDTDQRAATIKAAEKAGYPIKDKNGNLKEILLSEPRAALYDFVNLQNNNEIPAVIDFKKPKNIVVFDLGGGTLDVSIHTLVYNNVGNIDIKDLGVSRYTEVGGSNFDKEVGDFLLNKFMKENKIKGLDGYEENYLKDIFQEFAEEIKFNLNDELENEKVFGLGVLDPKEIKAELYKSSVYKGFNFHYSMSLEEYKEIVSKLLAENLTQMDIERINDIDDTENIIYPVLDALKKAEEKIGEKIVVDAIILNGGMTKFGPIQERIENFFGIKAYSVLDQDKSVARGAAVYNCRINNGEEFEKIQNDTIGLQRNGDIVYHLIPAGTVLPTKKTITDFVIPENNVNFIDLPFYLGRREDTKLPNRKIAERRVFFKTPLKRGDSVSMDIKVDKMGIMEIEGTAGKNKQRFTVKVAADGEVEENIQIENNVLKQKSEKFVPTGEFIEIDRTLKEYIALCKKYDKLRIETQKKDTIQKIKQIEKRVVNGLNGKHFLQELIKRYDEFEFLTKDRATYLLAEFGKNYPEEREKIQRIFERNISLEKIAFLNPISLQKAMSGYLRFSVEGLRKIEANLEDESIILNLINNRILKPMESSLIMTVGSICKDLKVIDILKEKMSITGNEAVFWALGKFGSRERKEIIDIKYLENIARNIAKDISKMTRVETLRNAIYALAEICDRRSKVNIISKELGEFVLNEVDKISNRTPAILKILDVCRSVVKGEELTSTQEKVLLNLRVLL